MVCIVAFLFAIKAIYMHVLNLRRGVLDEPCIHFFLSYLVFLTVGRFVTFFTASMTNDLASLVTIAVTTATLIHSTVMLLMHFAVNPVFFLREISK